MLSVKISREYLSGFDDEINGADSAASYPMLSILTNQSSNAPGYSLLWSVRAWTTSGRHMPKALCQKPQITQLATLSPR